MDQILDSLAAALDPQLDRTEHGWGTVRPGLEISVTAMHSATASTGVALTIWARIDQGEQPLRTVYLIVDAGLDGADSIIAATVNSIIATS